MYRSLALAFTASFALACSSSSTPSTPTGDAGPANETGPAGDGSSGGTTATISGTLIGFSSKSPVKGATVAAGGQTAMTDMAGKWSLTLPKAQPFSLVFNNATYAELTEQEAELTGDFARGNTTLVEGSTSMLLTGNFFPGYDATLGVLGMVEVANGTSCKADDAMTSTVNGATFAVTAAGSSTGIKIVYFKGGLPSSSATATIAAEAPAAVAYNIPVGVNLTVAVTHPTCTQEAYPVAQGTITYTGNVQVVKGLATSYIRTFLK